MWHILSSVTCCMCRYAFEALMFNEFHGQQDFYFTPYAQAAKGAKLPFVKVTGDTVLETFGFDTHGWWSNVSILVVLLVGYLTITLLLLTLRQRA